MRNLNVQKYMDSRILMRIRNGTTSCARRASCHPRSPRWQRRCWQRCWSRLLKRRPAQVSVVGNWIADWWFRKVINLYGLPQESGEGDSMDIKSTLMFRLGRCISALRNVNCQDLPEQPPMHHIYNLNTDSAHMQILINGCPPPP